MAEDLNQEFVSETSETPVAKQSPRTDNQRRRLMIAAIAGVPAIVASSARTSQAQTGQASAVSTGSTG